MKYRIEIVDDKTGLVIKDATFDEESKVDKFDQIFEKPMGTIEDEDGIEYLWRFVIKETVRVEAANVMIHRYRVKIREIVAGKKTMI